MQQLACNYPLEKDEDTPEDKRHLKAKREPPQGAPENSSNAGVPWKLPAAGPLSRVEITEPPVPRVQPRGCGTSPRHPLESLSKKHCENRGIVSTLIGKLQAEFPPRPL
ncbi:hypothetical protein CB1_000508002 [Camelus ferus]|nr:hypothetical protein CB1_000508002 [Camelus ferus]